MIKRNKKYLDLVWYINWAGSERKPISIFLLIAWINFRKFSFRKSKKA